MSLYIGLFGFLLILTVISFVKKRYSKLVSLIMLSVLAIFSGIRYGIGNDYFVYRKIYNAVGTLNDVVQGNSNFSSIKGVEESYLLLNSILKTVGINFEVLIFLCSVLGLLFIYKASQKYTEYVSLALLIYFVRFYFTRDMDQIRNAIACAILFYSFSFIKNKDYKRFLIYTAVALIFHKLALLNLIILVVYKLAGNRKKVYTYLLAVSFIIGIFNLAGTMSSLLIQSLPNNIAGYLINESFVKGPGFKNPVLIFQLLIIIYLIYHYEQFNNKIKYFDIIFCSYFISTCWMLVFNRFYAVSGRVSTVFSTVEIVLIPFIFQKYVSEVKKSLRYFGYILISLYIVGIFSYSLISNARVRLTPYRTIFSVNEGILNEQDKCAIYNLHLGELWTG